MVFNPATFRPHDPRARLQPTRRNGQGEWFFFPQDCPTGVDCCPDKAMGYRYYLNVDANPRVLPEIPRGSKRFTTLFKERTSVERSHAVEDAYHLDHCTHHALYGLIRLTLVNIAKHARLRWLEQAKTASARQILQEVMSRLTVELVTTTPAQ